MKKFIIGFLIGAMIFGTVGYAVTYVAQPATFKVMVNGKEFVSDPPALVVEGRTYLPLRAMGDALGVPVEWNAELNQAEVGTVTEEVNKAIEVDGNATVDGIEFSQLSITPTEYTTYCRVEVANKTGKDLTTMMFQIVFFDKDGNRIGVASLGAINDIKNKETKTATLYTSDNVSKAVSARYEIQYKG